MAGAPVGNQNSKGNDKFRRAILRALARRYGSVKLGLDEVADKLVDEAIAKERWAIEGIGDRVDGKPKQAQEISGPNGGAVPVAVIERRVIGPKAGN